MLSGGRIEVCYSVQTVVDAKHKLIVAEDVTNAAGDRDHLSPLATATQEVLGGATPVVVADQGYERTCWWRWRTASRATARSSPSARR